MPSRIWPVLCKGDPDNKLGRLKPVLPWHSNAKRQPILGQMPVAINSESCKCQWMNRLFQRQRFNIRPFERTESRSLSRQLIRPIHTGECHIARSPHGFHHLDNVSQWASVVGNHHGPGFNTTKIIDPFFQVAKGHPHQLINIECARSVTKAIKSY